MAVYEFAGAYDAAVLDTNSQLLKNTAFDLVVEPGGAPATLYTDRVRTATVAQPFLSDAEGNVHLFTDPGRYRLRQVGSPPGEELTVQPDPDETEGELEAHVADPSDAHDASAVSFVPTGTISATDVQAAIAEVSAEGGGGVTDHGALTGLADDDHPQYQTASESQAQVDAHTTDPVDAHDASAVSNVPAGTIAATNVQTAINELDAEKAPVSEPVAGAHITDPTDAHDASAVSFVPGGSIAATDVQTAIAEVATDYIAADAAHAGAADPHAVYLTNGEHDARDHSVPAGTVILDDLQNVTVPAPVASDVLTFDGANWVNSPSGGGLTPAAHDARDHSIVAPTILLQELGDVSDVSPLNAQVPQYNAGLGMYVPTTVTPFTSVIPAGAVVFGDPVAPNTLGSDVADFNYDQSINRLRIGPLGANRRILVEPTGFFLFDDGTGNGESPSIWFGSDFGVRAFRHRNEVGEPVLFGDVAGAILSLYGVGAGMGTRRSVGINFNSLSGTITPSGFLEVQGNDVATPIAVLKQSGGQTAPMLRFNTAGGTPGTELFSFDFDGFPKWVAAKETVAVPIGATKRFAIKDSAGATYYVTGQQLV